MNRTKDLYGDLSYEAKEGYMPCFSFFRHLCKLPWLLALQQIPRGKYCETTTPVINIYGPSREVVGHTTGGQAKEKHTPCLINNRVSYARKSFENEIE